LRTQNKQLQRAQYDCITW